MPNLDRMQYRYRHGRDQRVQDVLKELNFTIKSDALQICGSNIKCLRDRGDILNNHNNSGQTALMYITIILVIYGLGLVVLLLHFVKQKYGQINLYDMYLEVCPSALTGEEPTPDPHPHVVDEVDEDFDEFEEAEPEFGDDDKLVVKVLRSPSSNGTTSCPTEAIPLQDISASPAPVRSVHFSLTSERPRNGINRLQTRVPSPKCEAATSSSSSSPQIPIKSGILLSRLSEEDETAAASTNLHKPDDWHNKGSSSPTTTNIMAAVSHKLNDSALLLRQSCEAVGAVEAEEKRRQSLSNGARAMQQPSHLPPPPTETSL